MPSMSLTLALSILAALVLLALVVQSLWNARKSSPRRAEPAAQATAAPRVEPPLGGDMTPMASAPNAPPSAELVDARHGGDAAVTAASAAVGLAGEAVAPGVEPVVGAAVAEAGVAPAAAETIAAPVAAPAPRMGPRIDALIDVIATLKLDARVSGELVQAHLPTTRRAGTKPFLIEGLNAATAEWEPIQPGQQYRELQVGVQLANRHGALNEIEYSEFVQKLQPFADSVGAAVEIPDMLEAVGRAKELDHFANQHDALLSVQLVAHGQPWSVAYLQQATLKHGFLPGSVPGRLVLPGAGEGAPPVLVLSFDPKAALAEDPNGAGAVVRVAQLSLDVPQTPETDGPFETWLKAMSTLSTELDATLVDEANHPVVPEAFAPIKTELEGLYRQLEARDLAAGSAAARRLFS